MSDEPSMEQQDAWRIECVGDAASPLAELLRDVANELDSGRVDPTTVLDVAVSQTCGCTWVAMAGHGVRLAHDELCVTRSHQPERSLVRASTGAPWTHEHGHGSSMMNTSVTESVSAARPARDERGDRPSSRR